MSSINIFLENTYDEYNIDEVAIYNDIVKMAEYIFSDSNVMNQSCLKNYEYNTVCFDIVFVNNEEIHRINKEYRQKDFPTDVITFAIFADSPKEEQYIFDGEVNLGEIVVSLDKIEEQSKENNGSFNDELYFIVAHGILHLLGFDNQTEDDYNFMVEHQNKSKAILL